MKMRKLRLFRVWDIFLIILLLLLVGLSVYFATAPEKGAFAEIYVNGKLVQKVSLTKSERVELEHLTVVVSGGSVHVEDADCPDKICEKRGDINKTGQSIVCAPARVVVKIGGKGEVEAIS